MPLKSAQETVENLYKSSQDQFGRTIEEGREQFEGAIRAGNEQLESLARTGAQTVQKTLEQGVEATKKQLDDVFRSCDDLASFGRENVSAALAASSATAKAVETVNGELFAFSKKAYEGQIAALRALSSAKTPKEFFDIQSNLLKGQYEDFVAEANKLGNVVAAATTEAFAPMNARMVSAFDNLSRTFVR